MTDLVIRNAEVAGQIVDVAISGGRIESIGRGLRGAMDIDARRGALLPGLADHHIHLLATAARAASVTLDDANGDVMTARLQTADATMPAGDWLRATGYHEAFMGPLDRERLDAIVSGRPVRVQHQSGATWTLNSAALAIVGPPPGGALDGRLMRLDSWLRGKLANDPPPLAGLGQDLARMGITHVTDASVTTDESAAAFLADEVTNGALPIKLMLMSGGDLGSSASFRVGPLKILLDDADLPPLGDLEEKMCFARSLDRPIAVHCVTSGELAITLAALEAVGTAEGDRIEHGSIIPSAAIPAIRAMGLTVVTQPVFVKDRGDRYLANVDLAEQDDLYRCESLLAAGIAVAGSSDAPYGSLDPWRAMSAAIERQARSGLPVAPRERIDPMAALSLYLGHLERPGGALRQVAVGEAADLCLLREPLRSALEEPDSELVRATLVDGALTYLAS